MLFSKFKHNATKAYLSKLSSGFLKAPHLQSLFEEVKGVCDCFANHPSSTATDQASQAPLNRADSEIKTLKLLMLHVGMCVNKIMWRQTHKWDH